MTRAATYPRTWTRCQTCAGLRYISLPPEYYPTRCLDCYGAGGRFSGDPDPPELLDDDLPDFLTRA